MEVDVWGEVDVRDKTSVLLKSWRLLRLQGDRRQYSRSLGDRDLGDRSLGV